MKFLKSGDFGKIEENFHFNEKFKGYFFSENLKVILKKIIILNDEYLENFELHYPKKFPNFQILRIA